MDQLGTATFESVVLIAGLLLIFCLSLEVMAWCWSVSQVNARCLEMLCALEQSAAADDPCDASWTCVSDQATRVYVARGVSNDRIVSYDWMIPVSPMEYEALSVTSVYRVVRAGVALEYPALTPLGKAALALEGNGSAFFRSECWLTGICPVSFE